MKYQEFTALFKEQAYNLSSSRQLELAISINKKLFTDDQNFVNIHNWGNPDILIDTITVCEKGRNTMPSTEELKQFQSDIKEITPDMDDFGDEAGSYALNACVAVYYTLQFLIDKDPSNIVHVGTA